MSVLYMRFCITRRRLFFAAKKQGIPREDYLRGDDHLLDRAFRDSSSHIYTFFLVGIVEGSKMQGTRG